MFVQVIDGYLTVSNVNMAEEDSEDNIGTSQKDYLERFKAKAVRDSQKEYQELLKSGREIQVAGEGRAPLAYDAVWAIALSLNSTLTDYIAEGRPVLKYCNNSYKTDHVFCVSVCTV